MCAVMGAQRRRASLPGNAETGSAGERCTHREGEPRRVRNTVLRDGLCVGLLGRPTVLRNDISCS